MLAELSRLGPQLSVVMRAPGPGLYDALERGDLDLVFGDSLPEASGIVQRKVAEDDWQCLARIGHPRLHGRLNLQTWADLPHVLVGPTGAGPGVVDEALATRGLTRRIAYRTPYFVGVPQIVAGSDLVLTIPGSLARNMMHQLPLCSHPRSSCRAGGYTWCFARVCRPTPATGGFASSRPGARARASRAPGGPPRAYG